MKAKRLAKVNRDVEQKPRGAQHLRRLVGQPPCVSTETEQRPYKHQRVQNRYYAEHCR